MLDNTSDKMAKTKRLQIVIEKLYAIPVDEDFDYTSDEDIQNAIAKYLEENNMTAENEDFEHYRVVCSSCGISLHDEYEKEDGKCAQCSGNNDREDDD